MGQLVEVICNGIQIEPPLGKALLVTESGECKECFFLPEPSPEKLRALIDWLETKTKVHLKKNLGRLLKI